MQLRHYLSLVIIGRLGFASNWTCAELIVLRDDERVFSRTHQLELSSALTEHDSVRSDALLKKYKVDEKGRCGETLLWCMANAGNLEAFEYLLSKGANPLFQVTDSYNIMEIAASQPDPRFFQGALVHGGGANLISQFETVTPIFKAVQHGRTRNVEILLESGACPNVSDTMGRTPVIWASELGAFEIVVLLLSKGADSSVTDLFGLSLAESLRGKKIDSDDEDYSFYRQAMRLIESQ